MKKCQGLEDFSQTACCFSLLCKHSHSSDRAWDSCISGSRILILVWLGFFYGRTLTLFMKKSHEVLFIELKCHLNFRTFQIFIHLDSFLVSGVSWTISTIFRVLFHLEFSWSLSYFMVHISRERFINLLFSIVFYSQISRIPLHVLQIFIYVGCVGVA